MGQPLPVIRPHHPRPSPASDGRLGSPGAAVTRAEVAALTLALHVLRASVMAPGNPRTTAANALSRAWSLPTEAASWPCWLAWDAQCREPYPTYRLLRARLALYLRAVLRAERGEPWNGYVLRHWRPEWPEEVRMPHWKRDTYTLVRLARPLWLDAPEHR